MARDLASDTPTRYFNGQSYNANSRYAQAMPEVRSRGSNNTPLLKHFTSGAFCALVAMVFILTTDTSPTLSATPGAGAGVRDPWTLCPTAIPAQERVHGIPPQLLQAISLAESGRWQSEANQSLAWPWTVMAEGRGRYLPTKADAINEVMALQRRGIKNIDVGCMQINLFYHPDAFANLNEAFDPSKNVAYAGKFLRDLKDNHKSWTRAVGFYHSGTPEFHHRYRQKVLGIWQTERERVTRQARERRKEAIKARERSSISSATIHRSDQNGTASSQSVRQSLPPKSAEEARRRQTSMQEIAAIRREAGLQRHERMIEQHRAIAERQRQAMDKQMGRLDELRDRPWSKF